MIMDVHRAFRHLVEDELVLVDPPQIWERCGSCRAGRNPARLWRKTSVAELDVARHRVNG